MRRLGFLGLVFFLFASSPSHADFVEPPPATGEIKGRMRILKGCEGPATTLEALWELDAELTDYLIKTHGEAAQRARECEKLRERVRELGSLKPLYMTESEVATARGYLEADENRMTANRRVMEEHDKLAAPLFTSLNTMMSRWVANPPTAKFEWFRRRMEGGLGFSDKDPCYIAMGNAWEQVKKEHRDLCSGACRDP